MTEPARKRSKVWPSILLAVGALSTWAVVTIWREASAQISVLPQVCKRYGIEVGSPFVRMDTEHRECMVITRIDANSPLLAAGVKNGDIVLRPRLMGEFARLLDKPSGTAIEITVTEGSDGALLTDREQRTLRFIAPE